MNRFPDRPPGFRIRIFPGPGGIARAAAAEFRRRAGEAVAEGGRFRVALSGGSTPVRLFGELAETSLSGGAIPWKDIEVFWGDERAVPPDHPDSNFRTAREVLLARIDIPDRNVHPIPTLLEPAAAAAAYEAELRRAFGIGPGGIPRFDLIFLGMGADGHTASLFPGTAALREEDRLVVENRAGPQGPFRITLTYPVLNRAACVLFLVAGAGKAETLRAVLEGESAPPGLPARRIRPSDGDLLWFVDAAAAGALKAARD